MRLVDRVWWDSHAGQLITRNADGGQTAWTVEEAVALLDTIHDILALVKGDQLGCYHRALRGEPRFTLLARDPQFAKLVNIWADQRDYEIACGLRKPVDRQGVMAARRLAAEAPEWRRGHNGEW